MQTSSAQLEHRLMNVLLVDLADPTQPMELICDDYSSVEIQRVEPTPSIPPRIPHEALITSKFVREPSTAPFERASSPDASDASCALDASASRALNASQESEASLDASRALNASQASDASLDASDASAPYASVEIEISAVNLVAAEPERQRRHSTQLVEPERPRWFLVTTLLTGAFAIGLGAAFAIAAAF